MYGNYIIPEKFNNDVGKVADALIPFVTENRVAKMKRIVQQRSRQVCTVFENTHHAHNVSAVLRTMDSFGFLDTFFLYKEPYIKFRANDSIDRSASSWLMIRNFHTIAEAIETLKQNGYKIALVSRPDFSRTSEHYRKDLPSFSTSQLDTPGFVEIARNNKIALIFGTELYGLSEEWIAEADLYLSVDMFGFCESLNVSVCAGIILNALRDALVKQNLFSTISKEESDLIFEHWIAKDTIHSYEYILNKNPELMDWYLYVRSGKFY